MDVVVVLPCVPATAIPRNPIITAASAAARGSIRRSSAAARRTSGLSALIAVETTTVSALRSEEHTSELQSRGHLVCRLLLEKKKSEPGEGTGQAALAAGAA